jgi:hypothetical protein
LPKKIKITNKKRNKKEWKVTTDIKNKTSANKLTITKADKRKTVVILTQEEYEHAVKNIYKIANSQ